MLFYTAPDEDGRSTSEEAGRRFLLPLREVKPCAPSQRMWPSLYRLLVTWRLSTCSFLKQALRLVREDGGVNLTAGTDSSEEVPELPGVDVDGIRRANVCGLGHEVQASVTQEGKRLWLTGQSGASAQYLQQAMQLLLQDTARYAKVVSHLVSYPTAPRMFAHLLAPDPQIVEGAPGVKVIIDFTKEGEVSEAFDSQQWFPSGE